MHAVALADLARRYLRVFRHAWAERARLDAPRRLAHEAQFLPAALELQETPVSPAPRVIMWLLLAFAVIALLWAVFGRIEVVASAPGKIIPNDNIKTIQPSETATVKAIHVSEGQSVRAGDPLIDLDATIPEADVARTRNELVTAKLQAARATGLLDAIKRRATSARLGEAEGMEQARVEAEQRLLDGQYAEYQTRLAGIDAEIAHRKAEERTTAELVAKLEQTAPLAAERARDMHNLLAKHFVAKHAYLEQEQARIEQERDLAAQRSRLTEIQAALVESERRREALVAETRRATLDALHEAEQKATALTQELIKAEQRNRLMRLAAPVDGTVQQLAVHTIGGVVTPAQPLLVIVPKDNALEVEAYVANKDIGFVYADQAAAIKIETFPYTKYGTVPGQVLHVSNDAVNDEKRGLYYLARVTLDRAVMPVEHKAVNLTPGMAVTVEIKTRTRRVIEYFLSPLLQYKDESLRER